MKFQKQLSKKLHNKNGVSIIIALFAFLIATIMSVTITTAALTSVRRTVSSKDSMQSQISFNSAAGVIREIIGKEKVTVTRTINGQGDISVNIEFDDKKSISDSIGNAIETMENSTNLNKKVETYIGSIQVDEKYNLNDIDINMIVDGTYKLVFVLSEKDTDNKAILEMFPSYSISTNYSEDGDGICSDEITEIRWEKAVLNYD